VLRAVLDTNVVVAALRSGQGASFALLAALRARRFIASVSNPLCLEHLDVLSRPGIVPGFSPADAEAWLHGYLALCEWRQIRYLWRPFLSDANDERVLEAALASQATYLVTYNVDDFAAAPAIGVRPVTPAEFLSILRAS
jgi:predicted nucleic acid-binding protein